MPQVGKQRLDPILPPVAAHLFPDSGVRDMKVED